MCIKGKGEQNHVGHLYSGIFTTRLRPIPSARAPLSSPTLRPASRAVRSSSPSRSEQEEEAGQVRTRSESAGPKSRAVRSELAAPRTWTRTARSDRRRGPGRLLRSSSRQVPHRDRSSLAKGVHRVRLRCRRKRSTHPARLERVAREHPRRNRASGLGAPPFPPDPGRRSARTGPLRVRRPPFRPLPRLAAAAATESTLRRAHQRSGRPVPAPTPSTRSRRPHRSATNP
ncbi:hypothetical protein BMF94_4761 [Rhodotorula taiwanensis]|uniref:Uncharacterized protein n=1 Tax=Rhodotorula taiwanensis TaxID=741276 RepID=A0A2S5B637_9BASI|nr:hypothetical protein BMF94_4761 [Rhodotorula taiwanensis]